MRQGMRRNAPALTVAGLALFVALGGSVYAAKRGHGIDGRAVRVKSLPGNRLKVKSVPGNRLKPHSIAASALQPGAIAAAAQPSGSSLTGAAIDETTLGKVPEAAHADSADSARSAIDAQTALNAVNAIDAQKVNGYGAGCEPDTTLFAGACWQTSSSFSAATAPQAAIECAKQGGALPEALQLAAFAQQPSVSLNEGDEWSGDIPVYSGPNTYGVATVNGSGEINSVVSTSARHYRCVIPLLS